MILYYAYIKDEKIIGKGQCKCLNTDIKNVRISKATYDTFEQFTYIDGKIVLNPNYEEELKREEQLRVANLTMTALDFIKVLRSFGLTALDIKNYLDDNIELDQQLKYCQNVYCGVVTQLCPLTINGVEITKDMVETAFKSKEVL